MQIWHNDAKSLSGAIHAPEPWYLTPLTNLTYKHLTIVNFNSSVILKRNLNRVKLFKRELQSEMDYKIGHIS